MIIMSVDHLKEATKAFSEELSAQSISSLYGVTDGKAVGTYVEHKFHDYLSLEYSYNPGSSAKGIDFPELNVDLKVTSIKQPQSSCPFRDATQKVYGLGYHLLVLVYNKVDNDAQGVAKLDIMHGVFVNKAQTADYQTTSGIAGILERHGNADDIIAYLEERNLPLDEIGRRDLAERILNEPPQLGYLTISNALQWRLQYGRVVSMANEAEGVENLLA